MPDEGGGSVKAREVVKILQEIIAIRGDEAEVFIDTDTEANADFWAIASDRHHRSHPTPVERLTPDT
jgi:hypothetical protein